MANPMAAQFLKTLGVDEGAINGARDAVSTAALELRRLSRSLQFEFGQCTDAADPHNPAVLPYVARLELAAGAVPTVNFVEKLGKAATRGHVVNLGSVAVILRFRGVDVTGPWSGEYELQPGAVLDTSSFIVSMLEARPDGGAGRVQIFGQ